MTGGCVWFTFSKVPNKAPLTANKAPLTANKAPLTDHQSLLDCQ
jgi:hypothetical protein